MDILENAETSTSVDVVKARAREATRAKLASLLATTEFPQGMAQELLGCSRTSIHKWLRGEEISPAYISKVNALNEVLEMVAALGVFPLKDCKRRTVHATFYNAIATLHGQLTGTVANTLKIKEAPPPTE
jgi:hypothetical protein